MIAFLALVRLELCQGSHAAEEACLASSVEGCEHLDEEAAALRVSLLQTGLQQFKQAHGRDHGRAEPLKLTYFPVMAKGLAPSIALEVSELDWVGAFPEDWPSLKPTTPLGQLPVLEIPGVVNISEMCAIMNVVGRRKPEMLGADEAEFAISQMLLQFEEDLYNMLQKYQDTVYVKDKCPLKDTEMMWAELVPGHMARLERLMAVYGKGDDRFTGSGMTIGELALFAVLHQMRFVKEASLGGLRKFHDRVAEDERVQRILETGGKMPQQLRQYFLPRS